MDKKISIIGGDLRTVKLIELLTKDEYTIYTYALEKAEDIFKNKNVIKCNTIDEAIKASNNIIGPIPLSTDKINLNIPYSDNRVAVDEFINNIKFKKVVTGNVSNELIKIAEENKIDLIDIMQNEELTILNTISTAEGAIKIAIQETDITIHESNVLVMGFGRVGKILAKTLYGLGANVFCEARKESDIAWIKAYGYNPVYLDKLEFILDKFDIIMNTIPTIILDKEKIKKIKKECLVIDLASAPGGIDREALNQAQIKNIWALALPGKVAPLTSAKIIQDTIYKILT